MEKKYYIGLLENPTIVLKDDFDSKELLPVILEETVEGFIECKTKEKVFVKQQAVFDGHRFYNSGSSFYGTVKEEISEKDALTFLNNTTENYLNDLTNLKRITKEYALLKEKEYLDVVKDFVETFNKDNKKYAK